MTKGEGLAMTVLINVYCTSKPVNEGTTASYRMLKYCDIGLRWEKWFVIPACRESFFRRILDKPE